MLTHGSDANAQLAGNILYGLPRSRDLMSGATMLRPGLRAHLSDV
jgi:hypothetical protein